MRVLVSHLGDYLKSNIFGFEAILRTSGWHAEEMDENAISSAREFCISRPDAAMKSEIQKAVAEYAKSRPWIAQCSVKFKNLPYYDKSEDAVVVEFKTYPVPQQVIDLLQRIHSISDHAYTLYECGSLTVSVSVNDVYFSPEYYVHVSNEGPETCLIGAMHTVAYLTGIGFELCSPNKLISPVYVLSNKPSVVNND